MKIKLINRIANLLKRKRLPLKPISHNTIHSSEDMALEKYLLGKHFSSMSHYNQKLMVYDIGFLNHEAFRYYIFELILLVLEEKNLFSDDAFIQELFFSDYNRDKLLKFNNEERTIIIDFFELLLDEIDEVIADREKYNQLEAWEQEEVYNSFKGWEEDMKRAILIWKEL